jgi:Na+/proline symporter
LIASVPATIGAFYGKRRRWQAAFFSILSGASTSLILQITGLKPFGMWPGVWTLIASATVLWILNTKEG